MTSHSRKKSKKRGIEDFPETVVEHDLEDKTDPQIGKPLRLIGTNERKELVHHKEYYEVIKHIQYVYSGEYDEEIEITPMYKGDMPKAVIPKSFASPSLLASILDKKYKKDYDRITKERKIKSLPVLEEFYEIVKTVVPHTPKKSHLDTAMAYAINNEKYLRYYIEDGRVEISNNSAERCCKSFVIGRKNFLFSNSVNGAKASGAAYSIIESAKMNGLKPYEYIEYILTRMTGNKLTADLLEEIIPWSEELPKNLYKNKKA